MGFDIFNHYGPFTGIMWSLLCVVILFCIAAIIAGFMDRTEGNDGKYVMGETAKWLSAVTGLLVCLWIITLLIGGN